MDGLRNAAEFGQAWSLAKPGGTAAALERAHQLYGATVPILSEPATRSMSSQFG